VSASNSRLKKNDLRSDKIVETMYSHHDIQDSSCHAVTENDQGGSSWGKS